MSADNVSDSTASCPRCGVLLQLPATADVFISYAREDQERALEMANLLGAAGISHWLDRQRILWGDSFLHSISDALREAKAIVLILSSHAVNSPWVEAEVSHAKGRGLPILPLKVEEFELPRRWRFLLSHHQWAQALDETLSTRWEGLIERVKTVLLKDAASLSGQREHVQPVAQAVPEGVDPKVSPYVGPQPFSASKANLFFGRHHDAQNLLRVVSSSRAVLVYSPSGAGKTSLLSTVIGQRLEDQGLQVMLGARVGAALPSDVNADRVRNIFTYSAIYGLEPRAAPDDEATLRHYLKSSSRPPGAVGRVLVFDQFEEIFTQHRERFEDRDDFMKDLAHALVDDSTLRVIFALRQEYLADIDELADLLPEECRMKRFALKRIGPEGALEAIKKPAERYAEFAPGVAERLVEQLNTIKVRRSDGAVVDKPGEFIELVHLQIVCKRLWSALPRGITRIEWKHVEDIAEDKNVDQFVANALDEFYETTLEKVVNSAATQAHGKLSKELLQLGCMKFVTQASTRTMVQRVNGRTGRLPDWIVEQLENSHLLRAEQRGGHLWYELSHDRLADLVARHIDPRVSSLLYASDMLDKVLENALQEHGDTLRGYFKEHRDVLSECRLFQEQSILFPEEAEFVFRASLTGGQDAFEWSRRMQEDYPELRVAVLRDAIASHDPVVRCHAVELLGADPAEELSDDLAALALDDADAGVRRAAAESIARLDRGHLYERLFGALREGTGNTEAAASKALARIQITVDAFPRPSSFDQHVAMLTGSERRRIRKGARRVRLREAVPVLPFIMLPAAGFAAVAAALFKWLPGAYNWAISQATASAAMGIFHGVIAGIVWGGFITIGIILYHAVFGRARDAKSLFRPVGAVAAGGISGFVGSFLIVLTIMGVYDGNSLTTMGWLTHPNVVQFSLDFWRELFAATRFGWVYLVTGTGLGIGMGLATNALRASPQYVALLENSVGLTGLDEAGRVTLQAMRVVLPRIWPVPAAVVVASGAAFFVPELLPASAGDLGTEQPATEVHGAVDLLGGAIGAEQPSVVEHLPMTLPENKANAGALVKGLIGDGLTKAIGAYFAICGMLLGMVVMRRGLRVEPQTRYG